jgi:hypothetical protein
MSSSKNVKIQQTFNHKNIDNNHHEKSTDEKAVSLSWCPIFLITLRGKFDWISLVGEAAQHKLLIKRKQDQTDPERNQVGQKTGGYFSFLRKIEDPPTHTLKGHVADAT